MTARPIRTTVSIRLACLIVGATFVARPVLGQGESDIFLSQLVVQGREVRIGPPRNITARVGYDNQPSFSSDGGSIFYTSTRGDAQADIYRYRLRTGSSERLTRTAPESEYSATEIPGGGAISVIRVERDSTQRLWKIPLRGGLDSVLLPALKPVGYHVWADPDHLVMFVLGTPSNLVVGDLRTGRADTVQVNVGRSLHRIPGQRLISFVSKAYEERWYVMSLDVATSATKPIAELPKGTEDYAWLPDGRLIAGSGGRLLVCDPSNEAKWVEVADLSGNGVQNITRIAISPRGDRIALVGSPTTR